MRLSLRTLLAFEDHIFDAEQQRQLERIIHQHDAAAKTLHRLRAAVRNPQLGVPGVVDQREELDANFVAEYLDHQMEQETQDRFEAHCLTSDTFLAEIASVHQILAQVLNEPARVSQECRFRCYRLNHAAPPESFAAPRSADVKPLDPLEFSSPATRPASASSMSKSSTAKSASLTSNTTSLPVSDSVSAKRGFWWRFCQAVLGMLLIALLIGVTHLPKLKRHVDTLVAQNSLSKPNEVVVEAVSSDKVPSEKLVVPHQLGQAGTTATILPSDSALFPSHVPAMPPFILGKDTSDKQQTQPLPANAISSMMPRPANNVIAAAAVVASPASPEESLEVDPFAAVIQPCSPASESPSAPPLQHTAPQKNAANIITADVTTANSVAEPINPLRSSENVPANDDIAASDDNVKSATVAFHADTDSQTAVTVSDSAPIAFRSVTDKPKRTTFRVSETGTRTEADVRPILDDTGTDAINRATDDAVIASAPLPEAAIATAESPAATPQTPLRLPTAGSSWEAPVAAPPFSSPSPIRPVSNTSPNDSAPAPAQNTGALDDAVQSDAIQAAIPTTVQEGKPRDEGVRATIVAHHDPAVMFIANSANDPWKKIDFTPPSAHQRPPSLREGQYLLSVAPFRVVLELQNVGILEMVGDSKICLLPPDSNGVPGIYVDYGRLILRPIFSTDYYGVDASARMPKSLRIATESNEGIVTMVSPENLVFVDTFAEIVTSELSGELSGQTNVSELSLAEKRARSQPILGLLAKPDAAIFWNSSTRTEPLVAESAVSVILNEGQSELGVIRHFPRWLERQKLSDYGHAMAAACDRVFRETGGYSEAALRALIEDSDQHVRAFGYRLWGDLGRFDIPLEILSRTNPEDEVVRQLLVPYFREVMKRDTETVQRLSDDVDKVRK